MLRINVLTELRQPIGSVSEYEIAEASLAVDDGMVQDIAGSIKLLRTDRGLYATVEASGRMESSCSRCLKPTETPVEIRFQEEYVPTLDANTGAPVRVAVDTDTFRIDKRFNLDLREGLRQYILMSEPAKPLCRADCAGLCAVCGADLNEGPHECEQPPDERWSVLAGLKRQIEEGE